MTFTLNPGLLIIRALKNITATFQVIHTGNDPFFFNFFMKTQGFFGFLFLSYAFLPYPNAFCEDGSTLLSQNQVLVTPCMSGVINLHYDVMSSLLFILFLVIVILGFSMYYFKGDQGQVNYALWLDTEQSIRKAPLMAGFTVVSGLVFMGVLGLTYYMFPTPAVSESIEALTKPVSEPILRDLPTDLVANKKPTGYYHATKKGAYYLTTDFVVQQELNKWSFERLDHCFERINGKICYSNPRFLDDVKYSIYSYEPSTNRLVHSVVSPLEMEKSTLVVDSTQYYLRLSNHRMDHVSLHKLANHAMRYNDYTQLYVLQSHLEERPRLELGVLQTLDTRLPNTTLGQMSNRALMNACVKSELIQFYGLDKVSSVIPPRMEYMLNNHYPELVAANLLK